MFDVAKNTVAVKEDNASIVNRVRLLMLSDPTELYNDPTFGVGLKKYLWQYNTENTKAIMRDNIVNSLRAREPSVYADSTVFSDGLLVTGSGSDGDSLSEMNQIKMTIGLRTIYADEISVALNSNDVQRRVDAAQTAYSSIQN